MGGDFRATPEPSCLGEREGRPLQVVSATFNGAHNGVAVSPSVNGFRTIQAYRALFGKIMNAREGEYFKVFGVMPDDANDPDRRLDKRQRTIMSAHLDGFSLQTAQLSVKMLIPATVNGVATMSMNPMFGLISAYRESVSRAAHGLKRNLSDRKSGKRKGRPKAKRSSNYQRLFWEV